MSDGNKECHLGFGCIAYELCSTAAPRSDGPCVVRDAIAAEREACAKIAADFSLHHGCDDGELWVAAQIASEIRARGQTT